MCTSINLQSNCKQNSRYAECYLQQLTPLGALMKIIKEWEKKLDGKLVCLTSFIDINTNQRVERATEILKHQATNMHALVGSMTMEFQLFNQRMQGIVNNLATSFPHLYQQLPQGPSTSNQLMGYTCTPSSSTRVPTSTTLVPQ